MAFLVCVSQWLQFQKNTEYKLISKFGVVLLNFLRFRSDFLYGKKFNEV